MERMIESAPAWSRLDVRPERETCLRFPFRSPLPHNIGSPTQPRRIESAERRKRALKLRTSGLSFQRVGELLGISTQAAWEAVGRALGELAEETREQAAQLRELECPPRSAPERLLGAGAGG